MKTPNSVIVLNLFSNYFFLLFLLSFFFIIFGILGKCLKFCIKKIS
jgi:hypothetical protein